ncbi:MAG: dihydroneopterin triphosphate diphosphatase [Haliea sp.]|nr:MAG: dihydroneopterin triphosphate diphosphatase [Haliea sp.]
MKPFKLPESVLVVIHTPQREVLLIERADHPGFWQSVTGSRDGPHESLARTAQREVQEETGIVVPVHAVVDWHLANIYEIYPAWRHRYAPDVTHNTEHVFGLCVPQGTTVRLSPHEHTASRWLPWLAAADACFSPSNAEAVLQLSAFLPMAGSSRQRQTR